MKKLMLAFMMGGMVALASAAPAAKPDDKEVLARPLDLIFNSKEGGIIGFMEWHDGQINFYGKSNEAAEMFFNQYLKNYVDDYIKRKLGKKK